MEAKINAGVFQSLIGTLKTDLEHEFSVNLCVFQSLIGTLKTLPLVLYCIPRRQVSIPNRDAKNEGDLAANVGDYIMFQSLIGTLKTYTRAGNAVVRNAFQSLIGTLKTEYSPLCSRLRD